MQQQKWRSPLLKWPGGKSDELDGIMALLPGNIRCYREPFLGGGAVLWNMPVGIPAIVGDASDDLMHFYDLVKEPTLGFQLEIQLACTAWALADVSWDALAQTLKASRLPPQGWDGAMPLSRSRSGRVLEETHARKAALYALWRAGFNAAPRGSDERAAGFWLMRELAYNGMFRSNSKGGFNIPYGGLSYDRRDLKAKVERMREPSRLARLANTDLLSGDFTATLADSQQGDFIFLDPPYDSPFSTYDGTGFSRDDHGRLADTLDELPEGVRWLMVISATDFIEATYPRLRNARVLKRVPVRYRSNIKNRFNAQAEHLTIANYEAG